MKLNDQTNPKSLVTRVLPFILIFLFSSLSWFNLTKPGYFPMHDDLLPFRFLEMRHCLTDGQIPCRWSALAGAGYGQPLFNYYSPFVFYLGAIPNLFGMDYLSVIKLLFGLSLIFSGIFTYLLVRDLSNRFAGMVASILYVYAPYRAVDIYVRGASPEAWALALLPCVLWLLYRYFQTPRKKWFYLSAVSLALFFLCHNITTLLFSPVLVAWILYWLFSYKRQKYAVSLLGILLLSLGLASFFLIPAFLEKGLAATGSLAAGYYDFNRHFVFFGQLFSHFWGYGSSNGAQSGMSFQIGTPHWLIIVFSLPFTLFYYLKSNNKKLVIYPIALLCFALFYAFLTHRRSLPIWQTVPLLPYTQFPWRLLGLIVFIASLLGGWLIGEGQKYHRNVFRLLGAVLIVLTLVINYRYFRPERFIPMTSTEKTTAWELERQQMSAVFDFLPIAAKEIPVKLAPREPRVASGSGQITNFTKNSNSWNFTADFTVTGIVIVPVTDYPKWRIFIDDREVPHSITDPYGEITVQIPAGNHTVRGEFTNTLVRQVANLITLLATLTLVVAICRSYLIKPK